MCPSTFDKKGARDFRQASPKKTSKNGWPSCWTTRSTRRRSSRRKSPAARPGSPAISLPRTAHDLAIVLGPAPCPPRSKFMEERTVGPSLGSDSIRKGLISMIIGGMLVVLFMAVYYKAAGRDRRHRPDCSNILLIAGGLAGISGDPDPAGHRRHHPDHRHGGGRQRADLRTHP